MRLHSQQMSRGGKLCRYKVHFRVFSYRACAIALKILKWVKIDFTIHFQATKLSRMSNLNTFSTQVSDFLPYVAKIAKLTKM